MPWFFAKLKADLYMLSSIVLLKFLFMTSQWSRDEGSKPVSDVTAGPAHNVDVEGINIKTA